jgi:dipeptidyl aminopeptidase/acylaminoacyl peptidase
MACRNALTAPAGQTKLEEGGITMKQRIARFAKFLAVGLLTLGLLGCEPVSVSVNALGDIAFARAEGIFIQEAGTGKILTVVWNQGKAAVPVLVRWAPDNETLAYTVKPDKDSQSAELFVVKKSGGEPRQLLSADKIVTQLEWSPDGKYLSVAQQGADSELGVADLVLVDAASGMSKVVVKNCSDVHSWLDEKTVGLVKVAAKNPKNSEILTGRLSVYRLDAGDLKGLLDVKMSTSSGLDAFAGSRSIAFTALQVGPESREYIPSWISKADFETVILEKLYDDGQKSLLSSNYSPDKKGYGLKKGLDQATQDSMYDALSSAGFMDANNTGCYLAKVPDARSLDAKSIEIKAERLATAPANFVSFSPDGASLLLKVKSDKGMELGEWNLAGKSYRALVPGITDSVSANSSSVKVYPAWLGNGAALFFRENRVYGSNGVALNLMSVDAGSLKLRNLQPAIDSEVNRQVESRGGY